MHPENQILASVRNFPISGFCFPDITVMLEQNAEAYRECVRHLIKALNDITFDVVVCVESFGYLIGAPLAYEFCRPIALARKPNKLPRPAIGASYSMIYDSDRRMEMHVSSLRAGQSVLICDDFLASGGTAQAVTSLCTKLGASVSAYAFVFEIHGAGGAVKLTPSARTCRWKTITLDQQSGCWVELLK